MFMLINDACHRHKITLENGKPSNWIFGVHKMDMEIEPRGRKAIKIDITEWKSVQVMYWSSNGGSGL